MKISEVSSLLNKWAPPGIAWERDNPGLQVGDPASELKGVLLAFDVTPEVLRYAANKSLNLIISHHPLLFHPIKKINTAAHGVSSIIKTALKNDISIYSYHTNLDYTRGGVSFSLAELIGLTNIKFLSPAASQRSKLVVFVPKESLEKVAQAVFEAGGGVIGAYQECSFNLIGYGTFRGGEGSSPVIGSKGNFESVEEVRLEIIFNNWDHSKIIAAVLKSHPYEQPAFDIYKLENTHENYGAGAIGELADELNTTDFLKQVSDKLKITCLRHSEIIKEKVRKIAVCGGAGEEYIKEAAASGADVFITADIRYHNFIEARGMILIVDAGHFETESHILEKIKEEIYKHSEIRGIPVEVYPGNANPVFYYINKE